MSKFIPVILGSLEIAASAVLFATGIGAAVAPYLLTAGIGTVLGGIGTMLQKGPVSGTNASSRNPIAPWNVQYGRGQRGGTLVYINSFGDQDKYLDLIFVLACHPCKSFDALICDGKRVRLDGNGNSFEPSQQTINIVSITRQNDNVTVTLAAGVTDLQTGDQLQIQNVSGATDEVKAFNGIYPVTVIDATHFSYPCGGVDETITGSGQVKTLWPNYKAKIHTEVLLGNHTSTFPGMLNGTPYDGDLGSIVGLADNPWTAEHLLLGKTSIFLRLHYNDDIFKQGLPNFAFRFSGKCDILDPRASTSGGYQVLNRPTVLLNGWGGNAHVGAYEEGVDQGYNFGLDPGTTLPYLNAANASDGDLTTYASIVLLHTHAYAGCVWQCGAVTASPIPSPLYLNVLSEVRAYTLTGRSAGVWYSLNNGTTWTQIYNSPDHPAAWDSIQLPPGTDTTHIQVMAFTDAHDDMGHYVFDIQIANGPGTSTPSGAGYTENAALCIADYLSNPVWGFGAAYGTDIPLADLIAAANICDEAVPIIAGGTEPRYACNGGFQLSTPRGEVLQNLLTSCGGRLSYVAGQYFINPAAWVGPSLTLPLTPQNCFGSVSTPCPLPADAVIQGIYPVIKAKRTGTVSGELYIQAATGLTLSGNYGAGESINSSGVLNNTQNPFPEQVIYGASIGTTCDALVSQQIRVLINSTINATVVDTVTIDQVGFAVYYTSATPTVDTFNDLPFAPPSGQGVLWLAPLDVTEIGYVQGSGGIIGTSTGFGIGTPASFGGSYTPAGGSVGYTDVKSLGNNEMAVIWSGFAAVQLTPDSTDATAMQLSAQALAQAQGPFKWRPKAAIRDLYNGVKGTYIAPNNNWQASDFPRYAQDNDHGYTSGSPMYPFGDANLAADGGDRRWFDIQLPFTISSPTAQRLAKIELMRRRQQGTGTFSFNLALYTAQVLDVLQVTLPYMGWTGKLLEIASSRFVVKTITQPGEVGEVTLLGTEMDVQETDPSIYDWSDTEELTANGANSGNLGSTQSAGNVLANTYILNPSFVLSQPSATEIDLQACTASFGGKVPVGYIGRTFTIPLPSVPTWYYVTITDTEQIGDVSPLAAASCQADDSLVGVQGQTYMGAILALPGGGALQVLPGGWPPPASFQVGN